MASIEQELDFASKTLKELYQATIATGANVFISKGDPPERLLAEVTNFGLKCR